jgi:uncharacterized protein (DUF736 family)
MEKNKPIGALWVNETKDGKKYLSGEVDINNIKVRIVVFKNNYKTEDKHPEYQIFEKRVKEQDVL